MALLPTTFSRRSLSLLFVLSIFLGALLLASKRLGELCQGDGFCSQSSVSKLQVATAKPNQNNDTVLVVDSTTQPQPHGAEMINDSHELDYIPPSSNAKNAADHIGGGAAKGGTDTQDLQSLRKAKPGCAQFPDTSNILLVMKTGASEAYGKIPLQTMTNLLCLPEFFIYSDMEQRIAGFQIFDSLDTVLDDVKTTNKDFELYHRQKECAVAQESCNKGLNAGEQAWALDKYKNIHIAEKTYKARPDYDWYLFVDADTYVLWPTMVEWLKHIDPTDPHYLGSVAVLGDFPFAHGGSGYLVSQTAMQDFFQNKTNVANNWDQRATRECCGDFLFSFALRNETGIEVVNTWPTINGETPYSIPYNDEEWCQPIVTMHHMSPEDVSEVDAFEREKDFSSPMRIKDLYHRFVEPKLIESRPDWDNMSDDVYYLNSSAAKYESWETEKLKSGTKTELEKKAHISPDDCRKACESLHNCFQYRYQNHICGMTHKIKFGQPKRGKDDTDRWMSGWDVKKIKGWTVKQDKTCAKKISWPKLG